MSYKRDKERYLGRDPVGATIPLKTKIFDYFKERPLVIISLVSLGVIIFFGLKISELFKFCFWDTFKYIFKKFIKPLYKQCKIQYKELLTTLVVLIIAYYNYQFVVSIDSSSYPGFWEHVQYIWLTFMFMILEVVIIAVLYIICIAVKETYLNLHKVTSKLIKSNWKKASKMADKYLMESK